MVSSFFAGSPNREKMGGTAGADAAGLLEASVLNVSSAKITKVAMTVTRKTRLRMPAATGRFVKASNEGTLIETAKISENL